MTPAFLPWLNALAMGLAALFRCWADGRQDTKSRYTVFDVVCTAISGLFAPQALFTVPWLGPWAMTLHPVALAGLLAVLAALLSLLVFEALRNMAPSVVARLVKHSEQVLPCVALVVALTLVVGILPASAERISYTHASVNVGASSTSALAAPATSNARRIVILQNDSDTTIYCDLTGAAAVVNAGVRLSANGGSQMFDLITPASAINCIHGSTGNKKLLVTYE